MVKRMSAALVPAVLLAAALSASPASAARAGYTPEQVCGSGFGKVPRGTRPVTDWNGNVRGQVHLLYNARTGENCVVLIKVSYVGQSTWTRATLTVAGRGASRAVTYRDEGDYKYYAGPVKAYAKGVCVEFRGTMADRSHGFLDRFRTRASGGSDGFGNCGDQGVRRRASR